MNILLVFDSGTIGTDAAGPVSTVITQLANGYADAGHRVLVVDGPATLTRHRLRYGIGVSEVQPTKTRFQRFMATTPLLSIAARFASALARARAVRTLAERHGSDVIHVHDCMDAVAIGKQCSTPLLLTAHNLNWTLETRVLQTPTTLLSRRIDRLACNHAGHVVVLNQQTRRALRGANVSVIPNGIELANVPVFDRVAARAMLGIPADEFRVTYLGRIAPEKGTDIFVRAVDQASARIPLVADAIGSLSGQYGSSTAISRYAARVRSAAPQTHFHGFIDRDNPEFGLRLAAADAVIVPSITEPFGLVVLDALACGTWVIGSDTGGIHDTLTTEIGDLVPARDVDALARAIVAHFRRGFRAERAKAARARAGEFNWSAIVHRYLQAMHTLTRESADERANAHDRLRTGWL